MTKFNSVAKFSLTNKGINSCLFTEGALDFSPTKRNLLLILKFLINQLVRSATLFNRGVSELRIRIRGYPHEF